MQGNFRVVIAGGGRVGRRTAQYLDQRGHDIVVIEPDPDHADQISDDYVATVINGDATRPSILTQADLEGSDVVAALTGQTGSNLAICMLARDIAPHLETVMRIDHEFDEQFERFVDSVVFPERGGARTAANAIESDVTVLEDVTGTLEIFQIKVAENAPVAGRQLADIALPRGSLIVSDDDGNQTAGPETTLDPGRVYIVAAEPDVTDEVMNLMRG